MKKYIIFLLFALPFILNAQMTYVPDDKFEQALIDLGLDTPPRNDYVPTKNIDTVTYLDVSRKNISDLTGIEDFIALTNLSCWSNALTSLDVSKNTALKMLSCFWNPLTSLDVSKNTALENLYCWGNALTSLDVSKNSGLKKLACYDNSLTSLDVSKNTALTELGCLNNALTSLDVSKNNALFFLSCSNNPLSDLDISQNTALVYLVCKNNALTSLDVTKNIALTEFECTNNALTSLDVSNNPVLKMLWCDSNKLTSLDMIHNASLILLTCSNNSLTHLDMKNGNNLNMFYEWSYCFDASNNPNLTCIQVDDSVFSMNNTNWKKDYTAHYSTDCGYTGVEDFKFENNSVSVVPNPASDFIEINNVIPADGGILNNSVKIYNFLGEMVLLSTSVSFADTSAGGGYKIDVSGLAAGVYFIRLGDSVQRFVKY